MVVTLAFLKTSLTSSMSKSQEVFGAVLGASMTSLAIPVSRAGYSISYILDLRPLSFNFRCPPKPTRVILVIQEVSRRSHHNNELYSFSQFADEIPQGEREMHHDDSSTAPTG